LIKPRNGGDKVVNKKETTIMLKCDCGCSMLVVDREEWDDGEINYNISVQDSRYDHNYTTIWGKIKSAAKVLFGKPVYYSDIYIEDPEKIREFVGKLNKLCPETKVGKVEGGFSPSTCGD
jgi:hypothetical protein